MRIGGYEFIKTGLPKERQDAGTKLVVAWGVGTIASLTCFPLDTIKRRIMLDGSPGFASSAAGLAGHQAQSGMHRGLGRFLPSAHATWTYARSMYATGGLRIFYRGCLINAFKSAPATAVTFVFNDVLNDAAASYRAASLK